MSVIFCTTKSVLIRSYSGPHIPAFGLNTESISPYSVRMRENSDQNNSKYGHVSRSAAFRMYSQDKDLLVVTEAVTRRCSVKRCSKNTFFTEHLQETASLVSPESIPGQG